MGEAKRKDKGLGICMYCQSTNSLTDEHVIPLALGGNLILKKSSCRTCATETSKFELRLLRGHWWAYRRILRLPSRRPANQPEAFDATLIRPGFNDLPVLIAAEDYPFVMVFLFDPPSILRGQETDGPCAARMTIKNLGETPKVVVDSGTGRLVTVGQNGRISFEMNFTANDMARFIAKIALGYAIRNCGIHSFSEFFLTEIILGNGDGALTYVGCHENGDAAIEKHGIHGMNIVMHNDLVIVHIQLFMAGGAPLPIYEVVVGRLRER